ncbi:MAG TPA: AbrB/MazE/SpoVT family DNA-binding domain-containing protein [Candidatus Nanoarchaeia archaeon]|nr:AbrB/MazE/SpoVT family DNA-binding domain-containing protein [Candidatus Nanoarchaeia archaeon]
MKCVICSGKTEQRSVEHKEFGTSLGKFKAEVCVKCGEEYFDEKTAEAIQTRSKELGLFGLAKKAIVAELGNSIAIRIPKEIASFLNLKKGQEVTLIPEDKHDLRVHV